MTVYFIGGDFDRVKIGYTGDATPAARLSGLQCGSPLALRVITYCPGDSTDESALHREFADDNTHGEWFKATPRLMALIGYVEKYKTLESWREALADPQKLADFVAIVGNPRGFDKLGELPISEIAWSHLAAEPRPPEKAPDWQDIMRAWRDVVGNDTALRVVHFVRTRERGPTWECQWVGLDGSPAWFNARKGLEQTAAAVAEADSQEKVAALWIQACVREFRGRDSGGTERRDLRRLVPHVDSITACARAVEPIEWHYMCTETIPTRLCLPRCAVLSTREFVSLCAMNYLATAGRYAVVSLWADGAHSWWPRIEGAEVAA